MEQNTYATIKTYNFPLNPHFITNNDNAYSKIRVTKKQNGPVWLSVEDICKATGIIPSHVLRDINPAHLATFITYSGQEKIETEIDMISVARLQIVVARSKTVTARRFLTWVENEIIGIKKNQDDMIELADTVNPKNSQIDIQNFTFKNSDDHKIRAIIKADGSIWFVAKDVADVLGYKDTDYAIRTHCKYPEILKPGETQGLTTSPRGITIIPESDLYRLIMKSRLPAAERFEEWVVEEILPQIRRTGAYMPEQPATSEQPASAKEIPHINPTTVTGITIPEPNISHKAATAFVQAATDTFWGIEKALNEYKAMETSLKKAKKDVATIISSARKVFPDMADSINILGGQPAKSKLDVEMR